MGLRHQEDGASWCGASPLCGGSCGLPLPWVWGLLTAVLVFFLVPVWSLLHRGNLGKHADQILRLSKDHSQDKELVLLQLDAAAGWLHPATCLSPGSPTCPCSSAPSSLRIFPAASPVASLPPAHCQIPSKCHSKTPLTKLGLCYVAGHRQAAHPPPRLVPPCACVVATACSQEDGGPECSPRSLRTGSGSSQRQALRGARCGRGLGGCP